MTLWMLSLTPLILASTCLRNVMEQNESNRAIIYAAFMVKLILLNVIIFVN